MDRVMECGLPDLTRGGRQTDANVLSEELLRQIGKTFPTILSKKGEDNAEPSPQVQKLRLDLLHTAQSSSISPSHGAAALNALCGFLDICSTCHSHHWASLCFCRSTCEEILHILLVKSGNFKAKPAKQLLITLVKILSNYPDKREGLTLIDTVINCCVRSLTEQGISQSTKSSMQALEFLLNKEVITAENILIVSTRISSLNREERLDVPLVYSSVAFRVAVEGFVSHVLRWVRYPDCASAISRFLPCFFESLNACRAAEVANTNGESTPSASELPYWIGPVKRSLARDISLLESFEHHVLPGLLRLNLKDAEIFLKTLPLNELQQGNVRGHADADVRLCLLAVKMMSSGSGQSDEDASYGRRARDSNLATLYMNLIDHYNANVRLAAYALLISSSPLNAHLPCNVLIRLQECIPHFHQETNPRTRNEFIALMKPFCVRLGNAAKTFSRLSATIVHKDRDPAGVGEALMHHIKLARWYQQYLFDELRPTASYQSHITALKVLPLVVGNSAITDILSSNPPLPQEAKRSGIAGRHGETLDHVRTLLDLFDDPFDDVRQSAFSVLSLMLPRLHFDEWKNGSRDSVVDVRTNRTSRNALDRSIKIALLRAEDHVRRSGRADQADGVGRLYDIHYCVSKSGRCQGITQEVDPFSDLVRALEHTLGPVGHDRLHALSSTSLHGHLIALRYIVNQSGHADSPPMIYTRLLACCSQIWDAVRNILCFDALEGREKQDGNDDDEDDDVAADKGSRDILSFCWRALKESSLLMHAVVNQVLLGGHGISANLNTDDYIVYGRLLFTQLAELRHRGAFSTVAQTFAAWCIMCSKSGKLIVSDLPKEWYKEILACIQQQASSLTRRSAGLPAMVTGILAAYPDGPFFDDVLLDLHAIAGAPIEGSQEVLHMRLPQVHALNCLKDVFTDTRFGSHSEGHVATSFEIAISSLESEIWAIRNCGLMLLQALLKRFNGGADTNSRRVASSHGQFSPLTYEKFPVLAGLLLRLLDHWHDGSASVIYAQRVFPALEIVERFGIPNVHRKEIMQALERHRSSPIWPIREKAAKAYGMITEADDILIPIRQMIDTSKNRSQNEIHGQLLSLRVMLNRGMLTQMRTLTPNHQHTLLVWLFKLFDQYIPKSVCSIITAVTFDIGADVAESLLKFRDDTQVQHFLEDLKHLLLNKVRYWGLYSSPLFSVHGLEQKSFLRCLATLQDVIIVDGEEIAATFNDMFGTEKSGFSRPIADSISTDGERQLTGPNEYHASLRLWGSRLAEELVRARTPTRQVVAWIKALLLAGNACSELETRLAGVVSIGAFFTCLQEAVSGSIDEAIPIELMILLYDTLVDDDEDVRDHGAVIVSSILSAHLSKRTNTSTSLSLSPPSARHKFLDHLSSNYSRSAALLLEAVWRITGMAATVDPASRIELTRAMQNGALVEVNASSLQLPAVSILLESAIQQQDVVFEEEKQNLYLDPVMEAESWAKVAIHMEPTAWPPGLADTLKNWIDDGLRSLVKALDEIGDGPLGLTSKADAFALFMQVLIMVKVLLLAFKAPSTKVSILRDTTDMSSIIKQLNSLSEHGKAKDLHPLIIDRAQGILAEVNDIAQ